MALEIFQKYYTDKVKSCDSTECHRYDITYDEIFYNKRDSVKNVLEIGIGLGDHYNYRIKVYPLYQQGSSLMAWKEYFPNAIVYGWDILKCEPINISDIKTFCVNATKTGDIINFFANNPIKFDFILDDGSHRLEDQVKAFMLLHEYLEVGGIYLIEDVLHFNIDTFQNLSCFPKDFLENIINKLFKVTYHDTRKIGLDNDFCVCFTKI
jgi:hypothetical protein